MHALAHPLNTKTGHLLRADAAAVIPYLQAQLIVVLTEQDTHLAGIGVFADVIQQLLQQAIEGKDQGFTLGRARQLIIKPAVDPALGKGELIYQVVQRLL